MRARVLAGILLVTFAVQSQASAATLTMNADLPEDTQFVQPGVYTQLQLANTVPAAEYRVEAVLEAHPVALPDLETEIDRIAATYGSRSSQNACSNLNAANDKLQGATEESAIPTLTAAVEAQKAAVDATTCPGEVATANLLILRTTRLFETYLPIQEGFFATVTAYRIDPRDHTSKQIAKKVFDGSVIGSIRSNVLLGAVPNKDEKWFTKTTDDPNEFVITKETNRHEYDPLAALLLSWEPARDTRGWTQLFAFRRGAYGGSLAIGFGTNASNPIYLFGYSLHLTPRFGVAAGVGVYNQKRLLGIYNEGDTVPANLTSDQLMDDTRGFGYWGGITYKP